jgi:hypothetical protein
MISPNVFFKTESRSSIYLSEEKDLNRVIRSKANKKSLLYIMAEETKDKPTTEKIEEMITIPDKYEWSVEHERILAEWADKAMCYRWLHTKANVLYSSLNAWYTIPCIIISTLAGTANFAQTRVPQEYQAVFTMGVGAINIAGGIISTIQQFLKITQLNEAHRVSSISWDKFYRNIKIELTKHPNERIAVSHMLKMSKEEFDRLMETSPVIPDKIIAAFKKSFAESAEFAIISKPEICDVLISTEKFRNPWYTDENLAKKSLEAVNQSVQAEVKKKILDRKNHDIVHNFCQTFYNLNNREPMTQEVIDNLSEEVDTELIRQILAEKVSSAV